MQPNACSIKKLRDDMAPNRQTPMGEDEDYVKERNRLPSEVVQILKSSLQVGGAAGMYLQTYFPPNNYPKDECDC